jgi:surface polysaccharide O-acyltransferase-like enzyme
MHQLKLLKYMSAINVIASPCLVFSKFLFAQVIFYFLVPTLTQKQLYMYSCAINCTLSFSFPLNLENI